MLAGSAALGFVSCGDDFNYDSELAKAEIRDFSVTSATKVIYKSVIDGNKITLKVNPMADVVAELSEGVPSFYIPMGATCQPSPYEPQDFTKEVQYTVTSGDGKHTAVYTVNYGPSDPLPDGEGFSLGQPLGSATFVELGYPGEKDNFNLSDSRQYGDLNGYVAFCGHDHVVLMAGQYSNPHFDSPALNVPNSSLAFKVFSAADFSPVGNLNLGSIGLSDIKAITSDWNGTLVAVTCNTSGSAFYYWTSYSATPTLLATTSAPVANASDGSNYIQVAGDITGTANITVNTTRGTDGSHYMIHVENGVIASTDLVKTGYRSDDGSGFQMISPLKPDAHCSYLMGDTEGAGNNTLRVYANTYKGATKVTMPGVLQNQWQSWWVGTGSSLARTGARRPYVSSMYINGKYYAALMLGTGWWWHNDIADIDDLQTRTSDTTWAYGSNCAWSFGGSCDWYYDPESKEAYWVVYTDRVGVMMTRITCF